MFMLFIIEEINDVMRKINHHLSAIQI